MTPRALIHEAMRLVEPPDPSLAGAWGRAAALLARQALEGALREHLQDAFGPFGRAPFQAQLITFREITDQDLAAELGWTWQALSAATHHHAYPLPPTASELAQWIETVRRFIDPEEADA